MTNSNSAVTSASTASRTTTEIYREIERVKAMIEESQARTNDDKASGLYSRKIAIADRASRSNMRRRLADLRAEWDRVDASNRVTFRVPAGNYGCHGIVQPVCQKHQQIVASALSQFTVDAQVDGIFAHNNTHAARKVLRELAAAGYKIVKVRAH